jgi:hypothetical protein
MAANLFYQRGDLGDRDWQPLRHDARCAGVCGRRLCGNSINAGTGSSGAGPLTIQTSVLIQNQGSEPQAADNNGALNRAWQQTIDRSVRAGVANELRPGGLIWNANHAR